LIWACQPIKDFKSADIMEQLLEQSQMQPDITSRSRQLEVEIAEFCTTGSNLR